MAISPDTLNRAVAEISKSRANYEYFFERLSSPDWIRPLQERGLFEHPPPLEIDERGIRAEAWPPSKFLARVASQSPEQVLDVILWVNTSNERVHEDFANAAAAMPASFGRRWAEQELAWLRRGDRLYFLLPQALVGLVETLASGDAADVALAIIEELFGPLPGPSEAAAGLNLDAAVPRFSDWEYRDLLDRAMKATVGVSPEETLRVLARLLKRAIALAVHDDSESNDDLSFLWRTRVADHERDDRNIHQALVSVLRDASVSVRHANSASDADLVEILTEEETGVFRRISMFAINEPPSADLTVISHLLRDRGLFFDPEPSPEYRQLLKASFRRLDHDTRQTLLRWIEEGPELGAYQDFRVRTTGKGPTEHDIEAYAARWRIRRLALIRDELPDEWVRRYDQLVGRFGASEFVTSFEVSTAWGPRSPVALDDLLSLSDLDLVRLLRDFQGEDPWFGPSPEGLARELSALAEQEPERISRLAPQFAHLRPTYIQWTLIGLGTALRNGKTVDWTSLVELLEDVAPVRPESTDHDEDNYGRWGWVRKEVASVLEAGFQSSHSPVPSDLRLSVWRIVEGLSDDHDPSQEYEERYGGSNMDPITLALNTTRGRAMLAVIAYALWVHRTEEDSRENSAPSGFDKMPEVREVLDRHLDPGLDPSVAVRSVYGRMLPWLALIDERWASHAIPLIFAVDGVGGELRDAAWQSYILFCQPYNAMFSVLRSQYSLAVDRLDAPPSPWHWPGGPRAAERQLAAHLMSFFWRGLLGLSEGDGLLKRFFANAAPDERTFAIEFVGRALRDTSSLDDVIRKRLERLWEWRIGEAEQGRREDQQKEVAAFSWWADADGLSPEWRIAQLERVLGVGGSLKNDSIALAAIAKLSHDFPVRSVRLLRTFLEREKGSWTIQASTPEIEGILSTCLASESPEAVADVEDAVHWLGSLGYWTFRDLLRGKVST